jgi:hypothetical protein
MSRACSTYGDTKGAYRVSVGKPEGRKTPGSSMRRWRDNIKIDF